MSHQTKHVYRIEAGGKATVTVHDNDAIRKAFLFYAKSNVSANCI